MKVFLNVLRWIVFIPLILVAFYLIDLGFTWVVDKVITMRPIWIIVLGFVFVGVILGLFATFTGVIAGSVLMIPPNRKVGGIIFGIAAIGFAIYGVIGYWAVDIRLIGKLIVSAAFLGLWISLASMGFQIEDID